MNLRVHIVARGRASLFVYFRLLLRVLGTSRLPQQHSG